MGRNGGQCQQERERDRERERAPFVFALGKKRQQRAVKSVEIRVEGLVICIYVSYSSLITKVSGIFPT